MPDSEQVRSMLKAALADVSAKTLSDNIHNGLGTDSLQDVAEQWRTLTRELEKMHERLESVFDVLKHVWDSTAAMRAARKARELTKLLFDFHSESDWTAGIVMDLVRVYNDVRESTVTPEEVEANLAQLRELRKHNLFGLNHFKIAAAERKDQEYWERNISALHEYQNRVDLWLRKLGKWKVPKGPLGVWGESARPVFGNHDRSIGSYGL